MANFLHPVQDCLLGVKVEGTAGTYSGAFASADCDIQVFGDFPTWAVNANTHMPEAIGVGGTTAVPLPGHSTASMTFKTMWKGAGGSAVSDEPSYAKALCACGMQGGVCESIAHGGVTGTPVCGETFTQASTSATCVLIYNNSSDDAAIVHSVTGSEDNSNVWTGGVSGATFTPSATGAAYGYVVWPSASSATYSVGWISGAYSGTAGTEFGMCGARGTWSLDLSGIGDAGYLTCNLTGAPHADSMYAVADVTAISPTYDPGVPVGFKGVGFGIGGNASSVIKLNAFNLDAGLSVNMPTNANDSNYGVEYAMFAGNRKFTGGFDPAVIEETVLNMFEMHRDGWGADKSCAFTMGSTAKHIVEFYAPHTVLTDSLDVNAEDGVMRYKTALTFAGAPGATENEVFLISR